MSLIYGFTGFDISGIYERSRCLLGVSSWYSLQTFHVYILGDNISASSFFVFFPVQRTPYQNAYMDALGIYECASYLHSFGDESCFSFKI